MATGAIKVRLQLLATAQDALVLDLLHCLDPLISWRHAKPRARSWARGWVKANRVGVGAPALVRALSQQPANEIEIAFGLSAPYQLAEGRLTVRSLQCALKISPTNSLWAPVSGFTLPDREGEARRASYESRELALKWNGISACPTLFEAVFEIETEGEDSLLRAFWEAMPGAVTESLVWLGVLGCVDLHDPSVFRGDVLDALAPWPRSYPLLGTRFDDLHPILLGPASTCDGLAMALAGRVALKRVTSPQGQDALGLMWLPMSVVRDSKSRADAQAWLVPRDDSTKPVDLQESRGEFRVGAHVLYTQRRQRELQEQGRLPTLPPGFRYFPLVAAKYCAQLGIDPEQMPVELWQEPLIQKAQLEIDRAFEVLSSEIPLIERVWRAHEVTYRKWLYGPDERLTFLRERLFRACVGASR